MFSHIKNAASMSGYKTISQLKPAELSTLNCLQGQWKNVVKVYGLYVVTDNNKLIAMQRQ